MLAAKHFDPVVGIDIHLIQPPGPVPPLPIPHPFVGFLIDPADYVPIIGSTVQINGMHRAQAGTAGKCVPPHIPIGGVFVPPLPGNECEMFMGSATVEVDGDAQSYMSLPALSCQSIGMPTIPRLNPKKKTKPKCLMLPLSFVLPIPAGPPVMIGGPPTISISGMAMKAGMAGLGKLAKSLRRLQKGTGRIGRAMAAVSKALRDKVNKLGIPEGLRNKVNRAICAVTGHPVDIATGKVFTDAVDFELPGPLPLKWERVWFSTSVYKGPLGHGWHQSYDLALIEEDGVVAVRMADGRSVGFDALSEGESAFDRKERLTLYRDHEGYVIRDPNGIAWRFGRVSFDGNVQSLLRIENRVGNRIELNYDKYGHLELITDSAGRMLPVRTDGSGRIQEIRAPHPDKANATISMVSYDYDESGRMVSVRDALDQPMKFQYEASLLVRETDRNGLSFYFEYDGTDQDARCVHTWGDGGIYNHRLDYDLVLKQTRVTNSLGHSTLHFWNDEGLVVRRIDPLGGIKETTFSEFNQPLSEIDELGQATLYEYDRRGNLILTVSTDEAKRECTYNELDLPVRIIDALGKPWFWEYNEYGQLTKRVDSTGRETRFEYAARRLAAVFDPAGNTTQLSYDKSGNLDSVTSPDGGQSRWQYDTLGRPIAVTDPRGNVQRREHDILGRISRVIDPDGNVLTTRYDALGNLVYVKDLQHEVRFTYQGTGRMAMRREAGTTVGFTYNTEEDLIAITNEHGQVYRFELNECRHTAKEFGFDNIRRIYTRDSAGRVIRIERTSGLITLYSYDPSGRVTGIRHSDNSAEQYVYRKDGQLIEATNDTCTVKFERDAAGRILKEYQGDFCVSSEYGPLGLRTTIRTSLGAYQSIDRNVMGDVTSMKYCNEKSDPSRILWETQIQRDQSGLELARTLPGGIRSCWERDKLGRPYRQQIIASGGKVRDVSYEWGVNDRLQRVNDDHFGTINYRHDDLGNLAAATYGDGTVELRMPDAVGNLFRTTDRSDRSFGPSGQLLTATTDQGTVRYEYDNDGNLIRKSGSKGDWQYNWNAAGMLLSIGDSDRNVISFDYDAFGRRIRKHSDKCSVVWAWDGDNPICEGQLSQLQPVDAGSDLDPIVIHNVQDSEDGTVRVFLFDIETPAPVATIDDGVATTIVTDYLGTPCHTLNAHGETTWLATLSAYGVPLNGLEKNASCPFRWPGQYEDVETGLYYNRFRYYDSESGQFISQDPIRLDGGFELYAYVADPLSWIDPLGLACYTAAIIDGRVVRGARLKAKQALERIRRGLDVFADSASEAVSLAKKALVGKPMRHGPHGNGPGYLPHVHPAQHANASHIFYPP